MTTTTNDATLLLEHPIGRGGRLAIRLAAAEIRLIADATDRVTVRVPGGRTLPDRVILETTDGGVTIREEDPVGLSFGLGRRTVQLEVGLPAEAEVAIDTASGWIDALALRGPQRYRTASGDVHLRAGGGRIDVNAVSGDVTVELAAEADLAVRTVSGDVSMSGGSLTSLRVNTTSGDIRVDSPLVGGATHTIETLSGDVSLAAIDDMRVEARTVSGDLSSELPHRTEGRMGRRTMILGDGSIDLGFRSVSGDLHIHSGDDGPARPTGAAAPVAAETAAGTASFAAADAPAGPAPAGPVPAGTDDRPADEPDRMAILRALEAGEIDVATAMDRLATLERRTEEPTDG
jgi:hypothetical protein